MKKVAINFIITGTLFLVFVIFTWLVMKVDVRPIGPKQSYIGLASINKFVFEKLGVNLLWYNITECFGFISIVVALTFGIFGFLQLIKRKSLLKIDADIIVLGIFYILVMVVYILFEIFIVNYRPIILDKDLEASFPSSHSMIVLCIMVSTMLQLLSRIKNRALQSGVRIITITIVAMTVIGRLISGVHWFTDILAGCLLGTTLIMVYYSSIKYIEMMKN